MAERLSFKKTFFVTSGTLKGYIALQGKNKIFVSKEFFKELKNSKDCDFLLNEKMQLIKTKKGKNGKRRKKFKKNKELKWKH